MSFLNKRLQFQMRVRPNGGKPSKYPTDGVGVPLRITRMFPMKLKNVTVASLEESKQVSDVVCMTEMMSLFECFEKNEFNRNLCQTNVEALQNCYNNHMKYKDERRAKRKLANKAS